MPKNKNTQSSSIALTLKIVIVAVLILSLFGFAFLLKNFKAEAKEPNFNSIVCNTDNTTCKKTEVIYGNLRVYACTSYISFPKNIGNPLGHHTHDEANHVHWHESYDVDPATKEPLKPLNRTVANMLKDLEYDLPEKCNGVEAQTTVTINGIESEDGLQSTWNNDDIIVINQS